MDALPPAAAARFAAGHGVATLTELAAAGWDRFTVAAWAEAGLVDRLLPGLYRCVGAPHTGEQRVAVPLRYLDDEPRRGREPARVTGAAALALDGVEGFTVPDRPTVLVEPARRVRLPDPPFLLRRAQVPASDRCRLAGFPAVRAARALADAALDEAVTDKALRVGFDDARWRGRVRLEQFGARMAELRGHRGARRMLAMYDAGDLLMESEGERAAFAALFAAYPPAPARQVWVLPGIRVDFVYLRAALVLEYLGKDAHEGRIEEDAARAWRLRRAGYEILPLTSGLLPQAETLVRDIHRIRREREALAAEGRLLVAPLPPQPRR